MNNYKTEFTDQDHDPQSGSDCRTRIDEPYADPVRKHIELRGILQGIGCRPTVYRLALRSGLAGWVMNTTGGLIIEVEGRPEQCAGFSEELVRSIPFPGSIDSIDERILSPVGESDFRICESIGGERSITPIPPDTAVCPECVEELFTPENPRYLFPFITCTLCGPRFTVVRSFPYDRERTSMADFTMCPRCLAEYSSAPDRRFHSQTNSCPACGPRLSLTDMDGNVLDGDPMVQAIRFLSQGKILAIKGIGGFHIACDALNDDAVGLLRERKGRAEKPFAIMMPDPGTVGRYCRVCEQEKQLLLSPVAPIVLLEAAGERLAANVAPFMGTLGVMLPYSPVHHLLFEHPDVEPSGRPKALVMTSGNRSEEPIAAGNREALQRLPDLVDAFLVHNRDIVLRADDSIVRVIAGRATVLRRSRGFVPGEFKIPASFFSTGIGSMGSNRSTQTFEKLGSDLSPVVLGAGGDLKNCLAVIKEDRLVPGPHVGDLASPVGQEYFKQSLNVLTGYLDVAPSLIAVDPHPEYFSNSLARKIAGTVNEVFHHHAHAVSLLFEHGIPGPAIFAVFDGTGYGSDGTIWGGEFIVSDVDSFTRVAAIGRYYLPGGEAAIREPIRILAALLAEDWELPDRFIPLMGDQIGRVRLWLEAARKGINSPWTSSAGRLFDAVAVAAGFRGPVTFEGEAAMWLEGIADKTEQGTYKVNFVQQEPLYVDASGLIAEVAEHILDGARPEQVSARFHNTLADVIAWIVNRVSGETGITTVGLTGGCFQNKLLTERTVALLESRNFKVLLHETIPPNDGGIAVGQAIAALSRFRRIADRTS